MVTARHLWPSMTLKFHLEVSYPVHLCLTQLVQSSRITTEISKIGHQIRPRGDRAGLVTLGVRLALFSRGNPWQSSTIRLSCRTSLRKRMTHRIIEIRCRRLSRIQVSRTSQSKLLLPSKMVSSLQKTWTRKRWGGRIIKSRWWPKATMIIKKK